MVLDKNVAYLGSIYPHHAEQDIKEIAGMGCTSINVTVNEMDWFYYRNARQHIIKTAKVYGLKVYLNLHGFGIFASPIPGGVYQMHHPESRQVFNTGKSVDNTHRPCCPNNKAYREWLKQILKEMIQEFKPYGVFWDEPHFASSDAYPGEWACMCESCQEKYFKISGERITNTLTDKVIEFRQSSLLELLQELLNLNKEACGGENILCLMPWDRTAGINSVKKPGWYGVVDWEPFIQLDGLDVFATDPYWIHEKTFDYFESNVKIAVEAAHRYEKMCQIWTQAVWISPGKEEEVRRTILAADRLGADMVAVWSFRGEPGASALDLGGDYGKVWSMVRDAYGRV